MVADAAHIDQPKNWRDKITPEQQAAVENLRVAYEAMLFGLPTSHYTKIPATLNAARQQPFAIAATLKEEGPNIKKLAQELAKRDFERLIAVGCGDSYFIALSARYAFETLLNRPFEAVQGLEYSRYYHRMTNARTPVFTISSSGVVQRMLEALFVAKASGALTIAVTNSPNAPLAKESDRMIMARAIRSGPPTQSSTTALAALFLLALDLADELGTTSHEEVEARRTELLCLPDIIDRVVKAADEPMRRVAELQKNAVIYNFVGAGPNWGTVHFGYAKVREASWDHSMTWQSEEYDHEIAYQLPVGEPVFLVAPKGESYDRNLEIARSVRRDRGYLVSLVTEGDKEISRISDAWIEIPAITEYLTPLAYVVPLQLFAMHLAIMKSPGPDGGIISAKA